MCRRALEASPRCLWAAVRIAPVAAAEGDVETAAAALRAVLRAKPRSAEAWEALGAAYDETHRHSAALKAYARALQLADEEKNEKENENENEKENAGEGRMGVSASNADSNAWTRAMRRRERRCDETRRASMRAWIK